MAADLGSHTHSASALSSERSSPIPRTDDDVRNDKAYRRYTSTVSRALALFDNSLQEWADYISFLSRLLKALQSHPVDVNLVPLKQLVSKRLAQCLNPSLPSGVHQKALEIYSFIFELIGEDALSRDLRHYLPGLCPVLGYASLTIRPVYLSLLETYLAKVHPAALRPALKAIILALLPGLEEDTSEDFERVLGTLEKFRRAANADQNGTDAVAGPGLGGEYFWQCFFLASIASSTRRQGVLAFLVRKLPRLTSYPAATEPPSNGVEDVTSAEMRLPASVEAILVPEPGLLVRCFATGLGDEQLLVQRGFLDLLVTHLPLHSHVFQNRVSAADQQLLVSAAIGVVTRRDMSLNRRLWAWLLGPDPSKADKSEDAPDDSKIDATSGKAPSWSSQSQYFRQFGFDHVVSSVREMFGSSFSSPLERARPFRICLSLMDCAEVGGVVIPEMFALAFDSVRRYESQSPSNDHFAEVLRSARVFFDGIDSDLICGEILKLLMSATRTTECSVHKRIDKLALARFIITHFNMNDDEMLIVHLPMVTLALMAVLEVKAMAAPGGQPQETAGTASMSEAAFEILELLIKKVPERAFLDEPLGTNEKPVGPPNPHVTSSSAHIPDMVQGFYGHMRHVDPMEPPFSRAVVGQLLLFECVLLVKHCLEGPSQSISVESSTQLLVLVLSRYSISSSRAPNLFPLLRSTAAASSANDVLLPFPVLWVLIDATVLLRKRAAQGLEPSLTAVQVTQLVPMFMKLLWAYLSPTYIRHHIETVQCIWKLQAMMPPMDHTIEACICTFVVQSEALQEPKSGVRGAEQKFALIWTHSLQSPNRVFEQKEEMDHRSDRKAFHRQYPTERLRYKVMLSRPLFLLLDALSEEGTDRFLWTRSWLQSLPGVEKLLRLIGEDMLAFSILIPQSGAAATELSPTRGEPDQSDDLEPCIYYFETLLNVCRWCTNDFWGVMAAENIGYEHQMDRELLLNCGFRPESTILAFFAQTCIRAVQSIQGSHQSEVALSLVKLQRTAFSVLQLLLANPCSSVLVDLHLESPLLDLLLALLKQPSPTNQSSALDTAFAALSLQRVPNPHLIDRNPQRRGSKETLKSPRASLSADRDRAEARTPVQPPPPQLGKCLLAGFSSRSSRPLLDGWVNFLAACLPLFSDTIFQVLIPLVECLCNEIGQAFVELKSAFGSDFMGEVTNPDARMTALLTGLEITLAYAHDALMDNQARSTSLKSMDQPGFFGNMVSGVFSTDGQAKNAATNNRLSVLLSLHDAVRVCFDIWSWGSTIFKESEQDLSTQASLVYVSTRIRNKARRLLERLFAMEPVECPEILIAMWCTELDTETRGGKDPVIDLLSVLDGSRPKITFSAVFIAIHSRTNPQNFQPLRKSALTAHLTDTDLVRFLSEYARSIDDDAMDEIWADCLTFLRDVLANPFPHRQIIPKLLEFTAILGGKMDNTSFADQRMRRDLSDLFIRLLTATFTIKPMGFLQETSQGASGEKMTDRSREADRASRSKTSRPDDIVIILTSIVPQFGSIFAEPERSLGAAQIISTSVLAPAFRSKLFPDGLPTSVLELLHELTRLPNAQKFWKKDVAEAFNHPRFFSTTTEVVNKHWLRLIRQWTTGDKDRMPELLARLSPPTTAGIVFGVGATSARLDADRKAQLNLRRIALLILSSAHGNFVANLGGLQEKLEELLTATNASSPSSVIRADIYMVLRALILKISSMHLFPFWSVVSSELQAALESAVDEAESTNYNLLSVLQACKLLDTLIVMAPEEFQQMEWLFVTDSIDAVYRPADRKPVALVDRLAEDLGVAGSSTSFAPLTTSETPQSSPLRKPLLGSGKNTYHNREDLMGKVIRPFFSQLSIYAFETTYSTGVPDWEACKDGLLADLFDEGSISGD